MTQSSASYQFDVIIIGSGPAGEGAAMKLAKAGKRVAVIEEHEQVGGGSIHWGTIPSKVLRHQIQTLADYRKNPLFQGLDHRLKPELTALLESASTVIDNQVELSNRNYERNNVCVIHGRARLLNATSVEVITGSGHAECMSAIDIVLATGSRPYHPDDVDFSHPRIHDSTSILSLDHTPASITIYGAGVIGCEYASIFCNLDIKVNLVNTRSHLLSFLDDEITDALGYHLREQGTRIRHNEEYATVQVDDGGVVLQCRSGKKFRTEQLLWANGRSGNSGELGLEELDIAVDSRGYIQVDGEYRTSTENIYAVGDVVGPPGLASASYDQGRFVGARIADPDGRWELTRDFPTGIYTSPEISSLGPTERELTEQGIPYEVGQASFSSIARAQIAGHTVGMLKILFHRESLQILGIHCFGERASEIIHIGQAVMTRKDNGNSIRYFTETTFNFPTMAEAYRVAALNGLNRLF